MSKLNALKFRRPNNLRRFGIGIILLVCFFTFGFSQALFAAGAALAGAPAPQITGNDLQITVDREVLRIRDGLIPEYASLVSVSTLSLEEVQDQVLDTTLIAYLVLEEQTLAWVIDQESYEMVELDVSGGELQGQVSYLRKRIDKAAYSEIKRFLKTYSDTPLAWRLRNDWLDHLASSKRWKDYVAFYEPSANTTHQCRYLQALIATGKSEQALRQVEPLWLHGKSQPSACDPVFAAWAKAGKRSPSLVWQRIDKAMAALRQEIETRNGKQQAALDGLEKELRERSAKTDERLSLLDSDLQDAEHRLGESIKQHTEALDRLEQQQVDRAQLAELFESVARQLRS